MRNTKGGMGVKLKKLIESNYFVLLVMLGLLFIFFSLSSDRFLSVANLMNVSGQMVEIGLLTLGMSAALLSGGFDLSIGATASFGTVMLGVLITNAGLDIYTSMLLVLLMILGVGFINGVLVGYLRIVPMLATLSMQGVVYGLALGISRGQVIRIVNPEYFFGKLRIGGYLPFQFIILLVMIFAAVILFNHMKWGRRVFMVGTNRDIASYSGINVPRTLLKVYLFSSFTAFLAAVVISSRMEAGHATVLNTQVMPAVAAAVFGGVSIYGGKGSIFGAAIGIVTFSIISNGLNMMRVSQYTQLIIVGSILLFVLTVNIWRERRISK